MYNIEIVSAASQTSVMLPASGACAAWNAFTLACDLVDGLGAGTVYLWDNFGELIETYEAE